MKDTETSKQDVLLWDERDRIEGFIVADVGKLPAGVVDMQEALPALGPFASALKAEQVL